MIRLGQGESDIEIDDSFRIYFSTKQSNPHFLPEIFIRVSVINFTVTPEGLQEQLLGDVVKREIPEIEYTRTELVINIAKGRAQLKKNEDRILELLTNSRGVILDDTDLIRSLNNSKQTSDQVKENLQESELKQIEIEKAREMYLPVSVRGTVLYFVVADLSIIDPMYQFSLNYFSKLFNGVIESKPKEEDLNKRIATLQKNITEIIYVNICRGLFNNHKKIFSFLVSSNILINASKIDSAEWSLFVKGLAFSSAKTSIKIPINSTIQEKCWKSLYSLKQNSPIFSNLLENMM